VIQKQESVEVSPQRVAAEIAEIKAKLELVKPLYDRLDELTLQLHSMVGDQEVLVPQAFLDIPGEPSHIVPEQFVRIVDNFATRNTVFKAAGVRRFEAQSETPAEKMTKLEKALKKEQKC
jgi:hypothetical protein